MLSTRNTSDAAGVAVLGAGVVNPVAGTLEGFTDALSSACARVGRLDGMPIPRGKALAGLVSDAAFDGPKKAFRMAHAAIAQAIAASGLDLSTLDDVGVILATMGGESHAAEQVYATLDTSSGIDDAAREALSAYPNGVLLQRLCASFSLLGPRFVISNACASGNIAIGLALDFLRAGKCKAMIVVGVEVIKPSMIWGAERAGFVGTRLAPFHPDRDGAILGEGAAALVLAEPALAGHLPALGWVDGFGSVCDRGAAPITLAEDGSGLYRAMQIALDDAARGREQLDYVNAHAPGTRMIDAIECGAIARLRGIGEPVLVNSTKSITTHLAGAAAITEVIATLVQMRDGFVHGNAGLDRHDDALALRPLGMASMRHAFAFGLSNACGGGGLNTSVALSSAASGQPRRHAFAPRADAPLVITGSGTIAADGFCWRPAGEDGPHPAARLSEFDIYRHYPVQSNYHYMNRAAQLAAASSADALRSAGIAPDTLPCRDDRFAAIFGSCVGGSPEASRVMCDGLQRNPAAITPSMSLDHGIHLGAALVCRHFGLTGTTYTLTGSRRSGLQALEVAALSIRAERADAALVTGYDAWDPLEAALAPHLPGRAEPADAAGSLVLETAERAEARGARALARLVDVRTLAGRDAADGTGAVLADRLGRHLAQYAPDRVYLAAHEAGRYLPHLTRALDVYGHAAACLTLGDGLPDPRAALSMLAIDDAIARGATSAIVAPGADGTVLVAIVTTKENA